VSKSLPKFANMPDAVKWRRSQTGCELKQAVAWAQANKSLWDTEEDEEDHKSPRKVIYGILGLVIVVGVGFGIKTLSDTLSLACGTQLNTQTKGAIWEVTRLMTLARKTPECDMLNEAGLISLVQDMSKPPVVK
jgi:hypothetical protein